MFSMISKAARFGAISFMPIAIIASPKKVVMDKKYSTFSLREKVVLITGMLILHILKVL